MHFVGCRVGVSNGLALEAAVSLTHFFGAVQEKGNTNTPGRIGKTRPNAKKETENRFTGHVYTRRRLHYIHRARQGRSTRLQETGLVLVLCFQHLRKGNLS